ncbi:MAG: hypothetical protein NW202_04360 [Nitrospira sp.]|nr:hypothetical protein [Nitrospira sp.]
MMITARLHKGCVIAAFVLGVSWPIGASSVGAEMLPAALLASFKTGTVDVVYASAIKISGTEYRVNSGAKIMDHKENEITLEEVFLRSEAKFHFNKLGEIDMMIVMRPQ